MRSPILSPDDTPAAPSWALFGAEPLRAAYEYACLRLGDVDDGPAGDGHPVVVFPGLATDAWFTEPLQAHCGRLGYRAYDWGRGVNRGPDGDVDTWIEALADDVRKRAREHDRPVSLIGWSLGGIYAREIAKRAPEVVRRVITIGTPFAADPEHTNVAWLWRLLSGQETVVQPALARRLRRQPPVPTTSIYSRSDGVVSWRGCVQDDGPLAENVEVDASHIGLVWSREVLSIIADRLARPARAAARKARRRGRAPNRRRAAG